MNLTNDRKELLAEENFGLIHHFVRKYHTPKWEYEELVGAATIGMTKALNSFDDSKEVKFATYAARCIINAIFTYMRSNKKHLSTVSIDQPLAKDDSGKELTILDTLSDPEKELDWREISPVVNVVLKGLSGRKRKIMELFFEDKNQSEIAAMIGFSQSYVSRIINSVLEKINIQYWKGEKGTMAKLTLEEYKKFKVEGLSDKEIGERKSIAPSYISTLKKKWFESPAQPDTAEIKPSVNKYIPEHKVVEFERLIKDLRSEIAAKNDSIENLETRVQEYEHVNAACEDVENEIASLQEENESLKKLKYHNDYIIENQKYQLGKWAKEVEELQEENKALKFFAKKYLAVE